MADTKTIEARFVEAWGNVKNPELDCVNPHFNSRFASLKATLGVIREACAPQGLAYIQLLGESDGSYRLSSYVEDADGGLMELSEFPVETPPNPQAFGSEMTYKKRQQAQADWGIVGDDDEDGNAAAAAQGAYAGQNTQKQQTAPPRASGAAKQQSKPGRYGKLNQLKAEALELGITDEGMKGAIANILQGKPFKDATDTEIKACEACLAGLINDKRELLAQMGVEDGAQ